MPRNLINVTVAPKYDTDTDPPVKTGLNTVSRGLQTPEVPFEGFHDDTPIHMEYRDRVSLWSIFYKSVPNGIGICGMKYAFNPSEVKWRRISWLILVMLSFGAVSYHVIERTKHYASHPKSVDVSINYTNSLMFPTVAICNFNTFKYSHLNGTEIGDFMQAFTTAQLTLNLTHYYDVLTATNMSTLITNHGHTLEESIYYAAFKSLPLTASNFTVKVTEWGLCFMFNDADNGHPPATVQRAGKRYGLELALDVRQSYYFFSPFHRQSAGFQILIYDYGTEPLIEDHGFGIAPGTHTSVGIEVTDVTNLKHPYGDCEEKELQYFDRYGYAECDVECKADYYINACGCRPYGSPGNVTECNNWELFTCLERGFYGMYDQFVTNHTCDCPVPCHVRTYKPMISTTRYPSIFSANVLANLYSFVQLDYFTDNLCLLTISFQEMSIQQITQQKDYTWLSLLCDIGGSLGLWLGEAFLLCLSSWICSLIQYTFTQRACITGNRVHGFHSSTVNGSKVTQPPDLEDLEIDRAQAMTLFRGIPYAYWAVLWTTAPPGSTMVKGMCVCVDNKNA